MSSVPGAKLGGATARCPSTLDRMPGFLFVRRSPRTNQAGYPNLRRLRALSGAEMAPSVISSSSDDSSSDDSSSDDSSSDDSSSDDSLSSGTYSKPSPFAVP